MDPKFLEEYRRNRREINFWGAVASLAHAAGALQYAVVGFIAATWTLLTGKLRQMVGKISGAFSKAWRYVRRVRIRDPDGIPRTGVADPSLETPLPEKPQLPPPTREERMRHARTILQFLEIKPDLLPELGDFFDNAFTTAKITQVGDGEVVIETEEEYPEGNLLELLPLLIKVENEKGDALDVLGVRNVNGFFAFVVFCREELPPTMKLKARMPGGRMIESFILRPRGKVLAFGS